MPLLARRSDGANRPSAAWKPHWRPLQACPRPPATSVCPFPASRECGPRDDSSRNRGSADADASRPAHHVVKDLAPATAHPPLRHTILPGRPWARSLGLQTRCPQETDDVSVELRVPVEDDVTVRHRLGESFPQLLHDPLRRRMWCDVEMHNLGEQQKLGGGEPNRLILWRRGCINSKIDPKKIGPRAADATLCAKTLGGFPDFATNLQERPPGFCCSPD